MSRAFMTHARVSTVAAVTTVLCLAIAGQAWQRLGASEASEVGGSTPSVAFIGQVQQDLLPVDRLLRSVAGLNPVACRLASQTLENRWGRGAVSPNWGLPGDGGNEVSEVVRSAMRGDVSTNDVETLTSALGSNDDCQRRVAAQLLGRVDGSQVTSRLVRTLGDGSSLRLRIGAAMALGYGEWNEGMSALESALGSPDADLRRTAAWALGRTESPDAVAPLSRALRDSSVEVRANAAVALGWIESSSAVESLAGALEDGEVDVRVNAAWALGQIERPEAIPALTDVLASDANPQVRRAAAWALGRIE